MAEGYSFPACKWCVEYTPKPTGVTSGWHFPSNMPVADFTSNAATLNTYLNKVGGTIISGWYITSTEATSEGENYCTLKQPNDGTTYKIGKGERRNVRAILTFWWIQWLSESILVYIQESKKYTYIACEGYLLFVLCTFFSGVGKEVHFTYSFLFKEIIAWCILSSVQRGWTNYLNLFRKSVGDIPTFLLKNCPKADWSEKLSSLAICWVESSVESSIFLAFPEII